MSLLAQRPISWFLSFPPEKCTYNSSYRPKRESVTLPFVQGYSFVTSHHFRSYFFRLHVHRIGQKMYRIHLNVTAETTSEKWWLFNKNRIICSILYLEMTVTCDPTDHIFCLIPYAWRWKEKELPKQSRYLNEVQNLNQNIFPFVKKVQTQFKQLLPVLSESPCTTIASIYTMQPRKHYLIKKGSSHERTLCGQFPLHSPGV